MNQQTQPNNNEQSEMETIITPDTISLVNDTGNVFNLADLCGMPFVNITTPDNNEAFTEKSIVCHQLIEQYGSRQIDHLQLQELLCSWNLVDLFPYFISKYYFTLCT